MKNVGFFNPESDGRANVQDFIVQNFLGFTHALTPETPAQALIASSPLVKEPEPGKISPFKYCPDTQVISRGDAVQGNIFTVRLQHTLMVYPPDVSTLFDGATQQTFAQLGYRVAFHEARHHLQETGKIEPIGYLPANLIRTISQRNQKIGKYLVDTTSIYDAMTQPHEIDACLAAEIALQTLLSVSNPYDGSFDEHIVFEALVLNTFSYTADPEKWLSAFDPTS